ncbi:MAG: hypothetical protein NZ899_12220 [Thermoguttaceae bacterium]|nr:hypothetical protein [Thermoguttaceae bacterium]MDW8079597.1 hypothetical protein [Thermoguttaceae bacterium]
MNPLVGSGLPAEIAAGIELLADEALSPEEEGRLLRRLDEVPGAWRQCALALLEARALRRALKGLGFGRKHAFPGPETGGSGGSLELDSRSGSNGIFGHRLGDQLSRACIRPGLGGGELEESAVRWNLPKSRRTLFWVCAVVAGMVLGFFGGTSYPAWRDKAKAAPGISALAARVSSAFSAGPGVAKQEVRGEEGSPSQSSANAPPRTTLRPGAEGRKGTELGSRVVPVLVYLWDGGQVVPFPAFETGPEGAALEGGVGELRELFPSQLLLPVEQALKDGGQLQVERRVEEWLTVGGERLLVPVEEIAVVPLSGGFQ